MTTKLWIRELASLFNASERTIIISGIGAMVAVLSIDGLIALVSTSPITLPPGSRQTVLRITFGAITVIAGLTATVLCSTAPPRTTLQALLDLLPVSRRSAHLGQLIPVLTIGFVSSAALSALVIAFLARIVANSVELVLVLLLTSLCLAISLTLTVGLFRLMSGSLRRYLRLPHQYGVSIAAIIMITMSIGSVAGDFSITPNISAEFSARDLLLNRVLAGLISDPATAFRWVFLAAWAAIAVVIIVISESFQERDLVPNAITLFRNTRPLKGPTNAAIWSELLIGIRTPQTIVAVLAIVPLIAAAAWLTTFPLFSPTGYTLAAGIPVLPFLLVMYAVGRTLPFRWIGNHLVANESWWVLPKIVAYLLLAAAIAIPEIIAELMLSLVDAEAIPAIAARALLAFTAALIGGTLVPYSEEQSLSVTASAFVTTVLYFGGSFGISWVAQSINATQMIPVLTVVVATLYLAVFWMIATKQRDGANRRAGGASYGDDD